MRSPRTIYDFLYLQAPKLQTHSPINATLNFALWPQNASEDSARLLSSSTSSFKFPKRFLFLFLSLFNSSLKESQSKHTNRDFLRCLSLWANICFGRKSPDNLLLTRRNVETCRHRSNAAFLPAFLAFPTHHLAVCTSSPSLS
jgi:hypothetical protein